MNKNVRGAIVVIVFFLGIGAFYFGARHSTSTASVVTPTIIEPTHIQITTHPSPSVTMSRTLVTLPVQMAENYYTLFSECMKNPPTEANGQVSVYCQSHNQYAGIKLAANLEAQARQGFAPVICGQNPPQSIVPMGMPILSATIATVMLREKYGSTKPVDVTYTLSQEDGQWKVENITCPLP